jgi:hypothetical protein
MADNRREGALNASEPATSTSTPSSNTVSPRPRSLLKQPWLVIGLVVAIGVLVGVAWLLYHYTKGDRTFSHSLADVLLQVAFIVLAGAVVTELIGRDRRARDKEEEDRNKRINTARDEEQDRRNKQMNFMRRMREAHVRIADVQRLLYADPSPETYRQQMRVLMLVTPKLEDIEADIAATTDLFKPGDREEIQKGIGEIVAYLNEGYGQYVKWRRNRTVDYNALRGTKNEWLGELIKCKECMPNRYTLALKKSKGKIRSYVYGQRSDAATPENPAPEDETKP